MRSDSSDVLAAQSSRTGANDVRPNRPLRTDRTIFQQLGPRLRRQIEAENRVQGGQEKGGFEEEEKVQLAVV